MAMTLNPARFRVAAMAAAVVLLWAMAATAAVAQFRLLMFEQDGCSYCRRWNEDIGPAYPKTAEGRAAPLHRLDIRAPLPPAVTLTGRRPVFTPTFVLLSDGTEVGRIEGYAGDEFFWVLLDRMLRDAGWQAPAPAAGPASGPDRPGP
ncbi:hypothetical protein [Paracoccus sediminis]|nr:hypothetical protein [Paracoccus sediminis]